MRQILWLIGTCLFLFLINTSATAGGLYISEIATPASLGTVGVANVVNNMGVDSAYTNPAGMTGLEKDAILTGFQLALPTLRFDSSLAEAGGSDGGNAGFVSAIPAFYLVKIVSDNFRLGLSTIAPLGGGVDYGDDFIGRYQVNRAVLSGAAISPSLGYKINDSFSIGAGTSIIYSLLDQDISIRQPRGLPDGEVRINRIDD